MAARRRPHSDSTISDKQRALHDQQRKVREQMDRLQQLLEQAPKLREEEERRRREEFVVRGGRSTKRVDHAPRLDHRYNVDVPVAQGRKIKIEERHARLQFFALCVVLVAVLIYLYSQL